MFRNRSSEHSVRLRGLNSDLTDDQFIRCVRSLSGDDIGDNPRAFDTRWSLATQGLYKCATITCPSSSHKDKFRRRLKKAGALLSMHPDGSPPHDDQFDGVTMLHTPADTQVDVCLVHSVTGNSMDTFSRCDREWPGRPFVHWARDFLPESMPRARIMIYDYNSQIFSSADREYVVNWAKAMLNQIEKYRSTEMREQRPIIFVGYGYGGILIREAGEELYWDQKKLRNRNYETFDLTQTGFVFIATPHVRGSIRDMYSTASLYFPRKFGVRDQMYYKLQTFSSDLVRSRQAWDNMRGDGVLPHFFSFAEEIATPTYPFRSLKFIVRPEDTYFMGKESIIIPNRDHRSISAYSDRADDGFITIAAAIRKIFEDRFAPVQMRAPSTSDYYPVSLVSPTPVSMRSTFFLTVHFDHDNVNITQAYPKLHLESLYSAKCFEGLASNYPPNHMNKPAYIYRSQKPSDMAGTTVVHFESSKTSVLSDSLRPSRSQKQSRTSYRNGLDYITPQTVPNGAGGKVASPSATDTQRSWETVSILTLDGGGVRGLASLLMLKALMEKVESIEKEEALKENPEFSDYDPPWLRRPESPFRASNLPSQRPSRRISSMSAASLTAEVRARELPQPKPLSKMTFLPCHYFDYIGGAGTGGILAIMLGRLRMSVSECLSDFSGLMLEAFGRPDTSARFSFSSHKGSVKRFEDGLANLTAFRSGHSPGLGSDILLSSDEDLCRTIVVAARHSKTVAVGVRLLRSYASSPETSKNGRDAEKTAINQLSDEPQPRNPGPADRVPIVVCARATSSTPRYFKPLMIGDEKFKDGTLGYNNPSREVLREVLIKHKHDRNAINCLVSVGCGIPLESKDDFFKPHKVVRARSLDPEKVAAFEADDIHLETQSMMIGPKRRDDYFRFNATASAKGWTLPTKALIADMDKPGYHTTGKLDEEIERELTKTETQAKLETCARNLVRQRRERAKDTSRWHRFSTAIAYHCRLDGLALGGRDVLMQHFKEKHATWWNDELSAGLRDDALKKAEVQPPMPGGPQ